MDKTKAGVLYRGPNLVKFKNLTIKHDGKLVMTIFQSVNDRNTRKMISYFRLNVIPQICQITGEIKPMMMEKYLIDHFGIKGKELESYKFTELNYLIDSISEYFEL